MNDKKDISVTKSREVFSIKKEKSRAPLIAHIPHSSAYIPPLFRQSIVLNHNDLEKELLFMTDRYTDDLFSCVHEIGGISIIYNYSRVVFDPERFEDDDKEVMASRGMGVIYEKTSDGKNLRDRPSPEEREHILETFYRPYHLAIHKETAELLTHFDHCLILDFHSFPSRPLPYELDRNPLRPDVCLGTDPYHTPEPLINDIRSFMVDHGFSAAINRPFAGTYVPKKFLRTDNRVMSIMIEVNRRLYMNEETGERLSGFDGVRDMFTELISMVVRQYCS